jgi:hypothetical protein
MMQNLVRRIDWKITVWACLAFFALDLDRSNLSQANTDNFLEDMNLTTDGWLPLCDVINDTKQYIRF